MEPTKAPWATAQAELPKTAASWARTANTQDPAIAPPPSRPGATGRPVAALIQAEATIPGEQAGVRGGFRPPTAAINSEADVQVFLKSSTVRDFVGFIMAVNAAVKGVRNSNPCHVSPAVRALVEVLDTLSRWVDEVPPTKQSLRYGNPAYKTWFARLAENAEELVRGVLPLDLHEAIPEVAPYLLHSFGNSVRLDYGTGHETTFVALLYCLAATGTIKQEDLQAVVIKVFTKYLELMRKIQTTYWLEPAGSHGVWGLDDYQFMPFIWGSSQLVGHQTLTPSSIHAHKVLEDNAEEYQYLKAVQFVKGVKKGPLQETSPLLCDISAVPSWEKVNSGMLKMYQVEVLSKFPIVQHFLFGSILPFPGDA